jgi:peptide/nickel transport system permease protein
VIGFLLRRLAASLLLLFLVLTLTFFLVHAAPGDPTNLVENDRMTREQRENLRRLYGLDRPLGEQYLIWLESVALRGDWGVSFSQQRPVTTAIADALPATLILSFAALVIDYGAGLLLGVAAARRRGTATDHGIRFASLLLYSLPPFWLGLMAILLFAYVWPVLPAGSMHSIDADLMSPAGRLLDLLRHLLLPALVLGLSNTGMTTRFVRGSLLDVMGQDYLRTARAKGLSERRVIWVHGLRNAINPVIQLFALSLPALLSGSLITEVVFAWPGIGRLIFQAVLSRDYPLILGVTAFTAMLVIFGNFLADVLHAAADPRVRDA